MTEKEEAQKYRIQINKDVLKFLDSLDNYKYEHLIKKILVGFWMDLAF